MLYITAVQVSISLQGPETIRGHCGLSECRNVYRRGPQKHSNEYLKNYESRMLYKVLEKSYDSANAPERKLTADLKENLEGRRQPGATK